MGVFLLVYSFVFASPNPPDLLWEIDFGNGSRFTLRVCAEVPSVPHQVSLSYVRELLGRVTVVRPVRQALVELIDRPSAPPDRSALIRLPVRGGNVDEAEWIVEGIIEGLRPLVEAAAKIDLHLTLVVGMGFPYLALEKAIGTIGMKSVMVFSKRNQLYGPRAPRYRNWDRMPAVENPILLLPEPPEPEAAEVLSIVDEIRRLESEWKVRTEIFEEERELLTRGEQQILMSAAQSLSAEGQEQLRALIGSLRLEIAGQLKIVQDPISALMAAVGRIQKQCSRSLESS